MFKNENLLIAISRLCGWRGDRNLTAHAQNDYLAISARKAAVAIFNLDLKRALRELHQGATEARNDGSTELANVLSMVSVAISGYSADAGRVGYGVDFLSYPQSLRCFHILKVKSAETNLYTFKYWIVSESI